MPNYITQMWSLALEGDLQGIWFWAAVYAFLVCGYSFIYQCRILTWPSVRGFLQDSSLADFSYSMSSVSDREYIAKAHYTYSVTGRDYVGHRLSPWVIVTSHNLQSILKAQLSAVKRTDNNAVDVFYNPKTPSKSFLIRPSKLGLLVTLVCALGLAIGYLYRIHL